MHLAYIVFKWWISVSQLYMNHFKTGVRKLFRTKCWCPPWTQIRKLCLGLPWHPHWKTTDKKLHKNKELFLCNYAVKVLNLLKFLIILYQLALQTDAEIWEQGTKLCQLECSQINVALDAPSCASCILCAKNFTKCLKTFKKKNMFYSLFYSLCST